MPSIVATGFVFAQPLPSPCDCSDELDPGICADREAAAGDPLSRAMTSRRRRSFGASVTQPVDTSTKSSTFCQLGWWHLPFMRPRET
jgi:hypothetical protein